MIKKLQIFILVILLIATSGCGKQWVEPVIVSPIDVYSPSMSSVPGFPLDVKLEIDGKTPPILSITLTTNNGSFLEWEEDMKVTNLGKSAVYKGRTIYWTPFEDEEKIADKAKIKAVVLYIEKIIEVASSTKINIYLNKDDMYTFNK